MILAFTEIRDEGVECYGVVDMSLCPIVLDHIHMMPNTTDHYYFWDASNLEKETKVKMIEEWDNAVKKQPSFPIEVKGHFLFTTTQLWDGLYNV